MHLRRFGDQRYENLRREKRRLRATMTAYDSGPDARTEDEDDDDGAARITNPPLQLFPPQ